MCCDEALFYLEIFVGIHVLQPGNVYYENRTRKQYPIWNFSGIWYKMYTTNPSLKVSYDKLRYCMLNEL